MLHKIHYSWLFSYIYLKTGWYWLPWEFLSRCIMLFITFYSPIFFPEKNSLIGLSVIYTLPSAQLAQNIFLFTIFFPAQLFNCLWLFFTHTHICPLTDLTIYIKHRLLALIIILGQRLFVSKYRLCCIFNKTQCF